MAKKRDYDYFEMFVKGVAYSCKAAQMLEETLGHFDPDSLQIKLKDLHAVEHGADILKHDMMKELARAFITPIEREDIILLSQEIDNVTDTIEDVLMRVYMYNVLSIRDEASEFTAIILQCCNALEDAMKEFHNFRKSTRTSWKSTDWKKPATPFTAGRSAASIPPAASPSSSWFGGTCSTGWKNAVTPVNMWPILWKASS